MGMLTKYGTMWGAFPQTGGRMFFVGPGSSTVSTVQIDGRAYQMSDGNDGLSPERPLSTIARALALVTANAGDIIVLLPGTHNLTTQGNNTAAAALAFSVAGVTVIGLPFDDAVTHFGQSAQAIITAPASTVPAVCTAADVSFLNVGFLGVSGQKTVSYTTACNRLTFRGCYFDLTVGAASTAGVAGTGATQTPSNLLIEDSIFEVDNTGTSGSFALDVSAAKRFLVRNSRFRFSAQGAAVAAHTTMIKVNAGAVGTFEDNKITAELSATATITNGISGTTMTANGSIHLIRNIVGAVVTNPFTGFAAGDCDLALNYIGTVAGGTGGSLITSTT
jgi:hypothetical protein